MTDAGKLLGPAEVRDLADVLGVSPTKKLGQNFVHDANTVRKIVRLAGVSPGDRVLEIGPGLGSLTLGLTEVGARVTAVEIDGRLAEQLPRTVETMQAGAQVRVIEADALRISPDDLADDDPTVLVANLPYNVSVPILMHLLTMLPAMMRGLVMVQAEVGYRIAAAPGDKAYGAPSAKAAWFGSWEIAGHVSRKIFWPVPGVDSVLVAFRRREDPLGTVPERDLTFALINAAFAGRRKMLRQSLQAAFPGSTTESVTDLLVGAGIGPESRAEQLAVTDFLAIARTARSAYPGNAG